MIQCDLCKKYFDSVKDVQDAGTVKVDVLTDMDSEVIVKTGFNQLCAACVERYGEVFSLAKVKAAETAKSAFLQVIRADLDAMRRER